MLKIPIYEPIPCEQPCVTAWLNPSTLAAARLGRVRCDESAGRPAARRWRGTAIWPQINTPASVIVSLSSSTILSAECVATIVSSSCSRKSTNIWGRDNLNAELLWLMSEWQIGGVVIYWQTGHLNEQMKVAQRTSNNSWYYLLRTKKRTGMYDFFDNTLVAHDPAFFSDRIIKIETTARNNSGRTLFCRSFTSATTPIRWRCTNNW